MPMLHTATVLAVPTDDRGATSDDHSVTLSPYIW